MKKTRSTIKSSVISSSNQLGFFSQGNNSLNKLRPLYLFCTEETNNKLFFFISSSSAYCWVRKANVWEKLEIKDLLLARDGGSRTYCFKVNDYNIDTLDVPFPFENNAKYTSLKEGKTIALAAINLSQEELDCHDITNLEALDLTVIPETRKQIQEQLELAEKKQTLKKEIQNIEIIIPSLEKALATIQKLEVPEKKSIKLLTDQIHDYAKIKINLYEKQSLLEQPIAATIQTMAVMQI